MRSSPFDEAGIQGLDDHFRGLIEPCARFLHGDAEGGELVARQAAAETDQIPPVRHRVQHGDFLNQPNRLRPPRQNERRAAEQNALGTRGEPGQNLEVVDGHRIGLEMMLGAPDGVVADLFREFSEPHLFANHFRVRHSLVQVGHHDHITGLHA